MESQFDLLQSQVVALAADLKCVTRRLDKLDKPAAPLSAVVGDPKWDAPVTPNKLDTWWASSEGDYVTNIVCRRFDGVYWECDIFVTGTPCGSVSLSDKNISKHWLPIPPRPDAAPGKVFRRCRLPKKNERFTNLDGNIQTAGGGWLSLWGDYRYRGRRWIEEVAPVEEPSPGRWEQVVGTIWDFYKPGAYLDHLRVYESTPDDRAKILATFDPDFVSISKAEYLALKRLEAWVEAFKTNRGIFSPTQDKLLDAILREITDTREGKSNG